jgi:FdhD protein
MDLIQEFPVRRFEAGRATSVADAVIREARIELDINDGQFRLAMLCLPRDLEALAVGFLLGEGILRRRQDLSEIRALPSEGRLLVRGDFDADALEAIARRWTWATGCGAGGTGRDFDSLGFAPVAAGRPLSPRRLHELSETFHARADLWRRTGGTHACALAAEAGIAVFAEDIGRHNAFDKIMGQAALDGIEVNDKLVLTTGRISAEIVSKAVACRVPMLVSRSAVTDLAVKLATRFHVTLVGFLRGRRLTVYSGFERVVDGGRQGGEPAAP